MRSAAASTGASSTPAISVAGVGKQFGRRGHRTVALEGVDLTVRRGEFVCLLGASGCGKSTLLNLLAALDSPDGGTIDTGGHRVALMFQDANLFPWLTVGGNIELALKLSHHPKADRAARVEELLDLVHLGGSQQRRPHELSGGMRQRVALARVLAQDAETVLMDEPFGALDAMTRDAMHDELERIWSELGLTIVFVTHNVREAVRLSDRTVLMARGPGRIVSEVQVTLPRPRHLEDPEVAALAGQLTAALREEMAGHVA